MNKLLLLILLITMAYPAMATIRYVKAGASGAGTSWADASGNLQNMINAGTSGDEVWVAGGIYQPAAYQSFIMKEGVKIYGNFAGTETALSQRNLTLTTNTSTLKGNGNSVVYNYGNALTRAAVLDGFTVSGGNGGAGGGIYNQGSSPTISYCIIQDNIANTYYGGGVANFAGSAPFIDHCIIIRNKAQLIGGGIHSYSSYAVVSNCTISGNLAGNGGGIYDDMNSSSLFVNCLISGNQATSSSGGSGVRIGSSTMTFINCTVSANFGTNYCVSTNGTTRFYNSIIYGNAGIVSGTIDAQYSLLQGLASTANGNINGNTDPLFVNRLTPQLSELGDYRLQACSPAVNKGNNTFYASAQTPDISGITTDITGSSVRLQGMAADMGAYEFTGNNNGNPGGAELLAIQGDVSTATIAGNTALMAATAGCRTVATLLPDASANAVTGSINAKVWVESAQPATYVKRHYEITPVTNTTTASGKVTLYFTQAEFDDFNNINALQLPTGPGDAAGKANLLVEKRPGISTDGSGKPASYPSGALTIDPADAAIVWNTTFSRWEVSFDVLGFSGFFVKTQTATLPLRLLGFKASKQVDYNKLQWTTAEERNTQSFDLERSADGNTFTTIATITASGNGNHTYSYDDRAAYKGTIYYRLKMIDTDARFRYSQVISLTGDGSSKVTVYPNPADDIVYISVGNHLLHTSAVLCDVNGRKWQTIQISNPVMPVNVQHLTSGIYMVQLADGAVVKFIKR